MNICGHCGGMDRHLLGCEFNETVPTKAGPNALRSASSHDPQHAAPNATVSRSSMYVLAGLAMTLCLMFAAILIWP